MIATFPSSLVIFSGQGWLVENLVGQNQTTKEHRAYTIYYCDLITTLTRSHGFLEKPV